MLGDLLLTAGAVLLLFVVYQLYWTNLEAGRATHRELARLHDRWSQGRGYDPSNPSSGANLRPGDPIGIVYIPRLGAGFHKPVVQGVALPQLAQGVGHYPSTALPAQIGNFAVAGHRATHGEPFRYLDRLRVGDPVVVETRTTWLTYVVDSVETVLPDHVAVLLPVPEHAGVAPTRALMTLTTCTPRATSSHRLIYVAHLAAQGPKSAGRPAAMAG